MEMLLVWLRLKYRLTTSKQCGFLVDGENVQTGAKKTRYDCGCLTEEEQNISWEFLILSSPEQTPELPAEAPLSVQYDLTTPRVKVIMHRPSTDIPTRRRGLGDAYSAKASPSSLSTQRQAAMRVQRTNKVAPMSVTPSPPSPYFPPLQPSPSSEVPSPHYQVSHHNEDSRVRKPAFSLPSFSHIELATSTDRDSFASSSETKKRERGKLPQTSSYWRVNEMEMFPKHLGAFGKNWHKIAEEIGTKNAQQVKNYFFKNANVLGFKKIVEEAENGLSRPATSVVLESPPKTYQQEVVSTRTDRSQHGAGPTVMTSINGDTESPLELLSLPENHRIIRCIS